MGRYMLGMLVLWTEPHLSFEYTAASLHGEVLEDLDSPAKIDDQSTSSAGAEGVVVLCQHYCRFTSHT